MADAAYAELYAESRRGRNAGGAGRRAPDRVAPARCISLFPRIRRTRYFPTHYAGHYKSIKNQLIIYQPFKNRQSNFIRCTPTFKTPYFTGLPRSFPYQTFPYPADIPCN
ncbi:hypothetical protein EMIT0111MI5_60013 [Burkholderia sp. IT-111MI5]